MTVQQTETLKKPCELKQLVPPVLTEHTLPKFLYNLISTLYNMNLFMTTGKRFVIDNSF